VDAVKNDRGAFLGIDLGTTNIKAQIIDEHGMILASGASPVSIDYSADGAAEQDLHEIWQATLTALKQAAASGAAERLRAVGVSSQGGALQVLDQDGRPSGRVIGWQDSRGDPWRNELSARMGAEWFTRHTSATYCRSACGQILRLRERGMLPRGFRLGWVGDLVVQRLCGRGAHDATSLSEGGLYNPRTGTADSDLLALLEIEGCQLPDLIPVHTSAGTLLPDVARSLGLPAHLPVGPAVHDQYAAAAGCGAVRGGDTMLGTGTAWVLLAMSATLQSPIPDAAQVCAHVVPGLYGLLLSMTNGGSCVSWALRTLQIRDRGVADVDALMAGVAPGCDGLRFRPLLSENGAHGLPPGAAGRIDGLRLGHTPGHIVRALVEGLACELGRYVRLMARGGVEVSRLVMCGKAAASIVTPGIVADTTGLPVDCVTVPETSSLGAAVLARGLAEPEAGLVELADAMKPPLRRVAPGPGAAEAQARLEEYLGSLGGST
jgi:xylulokinase